MAIIDQVYGYAINQLRLKVAGGTVGKNMYVCDSVKSDVLIFGSSRARMGYDPVIIGDSLKMSCYNCGENGMGIIFDYARMKVITHRYMPKMVIIDVLPILYIMKRDDDIIFLNEMRPWYNVDGVDSVFWKVDNTERYKMLSKMYCYHSKFLDYILNLHSKIPSNGYDPAPSSKIISDCELNQKEPTDNVEDPLKMYYLERFIKDYRNKTKLVFVVSPRYNFKTSKTVDPLRKLCNKYHILLLDHYADPKFVHDRSLHGDGNHFNEKGATLFSQTISKEIKCSCEVKR